MWFLFLNRDILYMQIKAFSSSKSAVGVTNRCWFALFCPSNICQLEETRTLSVFLHVTCLRKVCCASASSSEEIESVLLTQFWGAFEVDREGYYSSLDQPTHFIRQHAVMKLKMTECNYAISILTCLRTQSLCRHVRHICPHTHLKTRERLKT